MKKWLLLFVSLSIISCNNYTPKKTSNKNHISTTNYTLNGAVDFDSKTAYLNKIKNDSLFKIDSSSIVNHTFIFKGKIITPERFALTFKDLSAVVIVILEPKDFSVSIQNHFFNDPKIIGSPLNSLLLSYKNTSKSIFKKINYLYPQFQKARLENDAQKLQEIKQKMETIENEFTDYSYHFIQNHKNSYIAAMLLSDHLKSTKKDTLKIRKSFNLLPLKIQNSIDGKIVAKWLQTH
jgi:hypothetical protein